MARRIEPQGAALHSPLDECPILMDVTYILTLLGMPAVPAAIISVAGFMLTAMLGNPVMTVTWIMEVGFAACAGATVWSYRRCRGLSWHLAVQALLAAVGGAAGVFTWLSANEPIVFSMAALMFYPAVLLALHGLWSLWKGRNRHVE